MQPKMVTTENSVRCIHVYKGLLELAGSSGAGRVISKLVTFADAVLTVSRLYRIPLDETLTNTY